MRRSILLIIFALFVWINLHASSMSNDSTKLVSIQKEMVECMNSLNNRTDYNSDFYLRKTIKTAMRLNYLANKYYDITNDSSVFVCTFMGELVSAFAYNRHNMIDSAYVHAKNAYDLFDPFGIMLCASDTIKGPQFIFKNDGLFGIMREWNVKQGNLEEAIEYGHIIIDACREIRADVELVKSLIRNAEIYKMKGDYYKSITYRIEALDKRISCVDYDEYPLASQIYENTLNEFEELVEKTKLWVNKKNIDNIFSDTTFVSTWETFFKHPLDFVEKEEKNGNIFWTRLISTYIRLGNKLKQFNSLFEIEDKWSDFIIRNYGEISTEYAKYLVDFSKVYSNYSDNLNIDVEKDKNRTIASEKEKQAIEIWNKYFELNPIEEIASSYQKLQKELSSQNQLKNTTDETIRLYGLLSSYIIYMGHVYSTSTKLNKYDMAYNAVSQIINIEEKVLGRNTDGRSYRWLGNIFILRNDFVNAEKSFNKAHSLAYEKKDTLNMAEANLWLFRLYANPLNNQTHNQPRARKKLSEAYKLVTQYSYHSLKKSEVLEEMADFYKSLDDYVLAHRLIIQSQEEKLICGHALSDEDFLKEANIVSYLTNDSILFNHIIEIAEKKDISRQVQNASELLALNYSVYLYNYEKGMYYSQKAASIAHELNDTISEAKNLARIGSFLFICKRFDDALAYMQKAEEINPHLKYDDLLRLMAYIHNDSIVSLRLPFLYDMTTKWLKRRLLLTSNEGREMLVWKMPYDVLKSMTYYYPNLPICVDIAYNSTLLYKGLLQNTQKTISEYIVNSNDKNLKKQYNQLQIMRIDEERLGSTFDELTQNHIETSELEMEIYESLSKKKVLADLDITWDKVRGELSKNEVAIEFIEISKWDLLERSAICYGALIVRRGYKHPFFVELESKQKIDKDINALLNSFNTGSRLTTKWKTVSERLYKEIWGKLEDHIHPGENVYFSTDGLLHTTPIEFLLDSLGNYANEKYNMFRLSSTRELCKKRKEGISKAVLYGGLLYDAENEGEEVDSLDSFQNYEDSSIRSGWNYLPASEAEVDSISNLLSSKGISVIKRKGLDGTEESFKELSGLDLSIIHIATHGFYFPQKEVRYLDYFQSQIDISPMKRSGLMMTGGQTAWMGKKNLEQEHDGILTSEEISKMDLSNVSLVVLSACQTGLGDIVSGAEGVIGIQRAFKLSGAQSLLMSLWKVDDVATSYMMQRFYSRMLSGDTKHNAFKTAQQEVRNKYPNPYYWAGFVMLD